MSDIRLWPREKQCEHSRKHVAWIDGKREEGWEPMCHPCALSRIAALESQLDEARRERDAAMDLVHPWYGTCDGFADDDTCSECKRLREGKESGASTTWRNAICPAPTRWSVPCSAAKKYKPRSTALKAKRRACRQSTTPQKES